jgi:hypothetical protein
MSHRRTEEMVRAVADRAFLRMRNAVTALFDIYAPADRRTT